MQEQPFGSGSRALISHTRQAFTRTMALGRYARSLYCRIEFEGMSGETENQGDSG